MKQQEWMLARDLISRPGEHPEQVQAAREHLSKMGGFEDYETIDLTPQIPGDSPVGSYASGPGAERINDTIQVYQEGEKLKKGWEACQEAERISAQEFDRRVERTLNSLGEVYTPQDPAHYRQGGIEPIVYIESHNMDFRAANVVKYITRYKYKGAPLDDLKKARWYLDRLIAEEEKK